MLGPWAGETSGRGSEQLLGFLEAKGFQEATTFSQKLAGVHTWVPSGEQNGSPSRIHHAFTHKRFTKSAAAAATIEWWHLLGDHATIRTTWEIGITN